MKRRVHLPKINGDTMTSIVLFSLLFCTSVVIWGMLQAADGINSAAIVDSALRVFGTELGICGVMTMFKRWTERQEKWEKEKEGERQDE